MADAVSTIGAVSTASQAATDAQKLADDLDDFMTLLTTQLQHQDPLDPMDATEFTSQLVQFASVEQQITQNSNLETLITAQENSQLASVASYVGRMAEVETDQVQIYNGEAEFNYVLHDDAASTLINIVDDNGRTVFSSEGNVNMGKHGVIWDGTDLSGQKLPDGLYKLTVSALDEDGATVDVTTTAIGKVTGVNYAGDEAELVMTNQQIKLSQVISIQESAVELSEVDAIAAAALKSRSSSDNAQSSLTSANASLEELEALAESYSLDAVDEQLAFARGFQNTAADSAAKALEASNTAGSATSSLLATEAAQTAATEASKAQVAALNTTQALNKAKAAIEAAEAAS